MPKAQTFLRLSSSGPVGIGGLSNWPGGNADSSPALGATGSASVLVVCHSPRRVLLEIEGLHSSWRHGTF
jgi:hypothetical protein